MKKSAEFSRCGNYRYLLWREWDKEKPIAMCIGLNPSTANSENNDATISRLIRDLAQLGFGSFYMCNLYALISSKPAKLFQVADPLGKNDEWLIRTSKIANEIIFCWGSFKNIDYRARKVSEMFPDGKCFGKNKDGKPMHPLALMYGGVKKEDIKLYSYR